MGYSSVYTVVGFFCVSAFRMVFIVFESVVFAGIVYLFFDLRSIIMIMGGLSVLYVPRPRFLSPRVRGGLFRFLPLSPAVM